MLAAFTTDRNLLRATFNPDFYERRSDYTHDYQKALIFFQGLLCFT